MSIRSGRIRKRGAAIAERVRGPAYAWRRAYALKVGASAVRGARANGRATRTELSRDRARSDMYLSHGARKHITAVPLIGRVVLIHEEIDNRDGLAAVTVAVAAAAAAAAKTTTTAATVAAAAAAVMVVVMSAVVVVVAAVTMGKQEEKAE